jgi:uncharacterized membrane protein HdeD (DUF308 family)
MASLVMLIGVLMVCMGGIVIANPNAIRNMLSFWQQGQMLYLGGLLRVLFGVIFISSSSKARFPWVIYVLGVLTLLAGALIFIWGLEKTKTILGWWNKKPPSFARLTAVFILALGVLIIYSA